MQDGIKNVEDHLSRMAAAAWECRERAYILGSTRVGAAAISRDGSVFSGCNIEHKFRCHDVHAEVNAISTMVAAGRTELAGIVIVAERTRFTPCGSCMDWIYQFGGPTCIVGFQSKHGGEIAKFRADELMPHYPE
jgi:cytidine deaminase